MQLSLLQTGNVDQVWPYLREGFQKALLRTGGDLDTASLWTQCRAGTAFLVIAHDGEEIRGASVWRQEQWQTGSKLRCLALYGAGMKDWIQDMREMAAKIAGDCGATSLVSEGRLGWQRVFPKARVLRALYEEPI